MKLIRLEYFVCNTLCNYVDETACKILFFSRLRFRITEETNKFNFVIDKENNYRRF